MKRKTIFLHFSLGIVGLSLLVCTLAFTACETDIASKIITPGNECLCEDETSCICGDDCGCDCEVCDIDNQPVINGVTITTTATSVAQGAVLQFNATVDAANGAATSVTWSITSTGHVGTSINASTGLLTVGVNEPQTSITIRAASAQADFTDVADTKTILVTIIQPAPALPTLFQNGQWATALGNITYTNETAGNTTTGLSGNVIRLTRNASTGNNDYSQINFANIYNAADYNWLCVELSATNSGAIQGGARMRNNTTWTDLKWWGGSDYSYNAATRIARFPLKTAPGAADGWATGGGTWVPAQFAGLNVCIPSSATVDIVRVWLEYMPPAHVPVTNITGLPAAGTVGTAVTLTGTVVPGNATNQTITWSTRSGSGAAGINLSGNALTVTGAGTVNLRATITGGGVAADASYTQDFTVTFSAAVPHMPVRNITGIPLAGTVGTPINLTGNVYRGTVNPPNATNKTIVWTTRTGGTAAGVNITNGTLSVTGAGTAFITATITGGGATASQNYTQDFTVTFNAGAAPTMYVALTFDDGPTGNNTIALLNLLDEHNVPATWFVGNQMNNLSGNRQTAIDRKIARGDEFGNHAWTHNPWGNGTYTADQMRTDFQRSQDRIRELTFQEARYFRHPQYSSNATSLGVIRDMGLACIRSGTNGDPNDWDGRPAATIIAQMTNNNALYNGQIFLLHDLSTVNTVEALRTVIPELKSKGVGFMTLSQLQAHRNRTITPGTIVNDFR
ncbi:MAG: polysaccharide deacetylase family protein [Treponema sp.]|nr:polysaccharide deacetylase family protein [Treponema sp.]